MPTRPRSPRAAPMTTASAASRRVRSSARSRARPRAVGTPVPSWTFLSNHGHVLICLAQQPDAVLREVARRVGITERAVQNIVRDLVEAGVLVRQRTGRQNHYRVNASQHLRHPVESHCTVAALINMVLRDLPVQSRR